MNDINPFWMVYGIGQSAPTYQHQTAKSATDEAERLARINPGKTFVVLEAIAAVRKREIEIVPIGRGRMDELTDDIPF